MDSYQHLLDTLLNRRSRRFGLGMRIPDGPFTYASQQASVPLSEGEEAALAFAGCGVTGYALADLSYGVGQGGQMLAGLLGRTISSADAINTVSLFVTNDHGTWLVKRPQDFSPAEYPALVELAHAGQLLELYRRSRVQVSDRRAAPPVVPGINFNINKWSLYTPGGTYLVPVNELTALYINALLESFDEQMGLFIIDERAGFQPAGIARFGRSRGGTLQDDFNGGRVGTIQVLENALMEAAAIEQGMLLQNIGLMAQALGLGGYPNFAPHPAAWFEALGFRMGHQPATRYLGAPRLFSFLLGVLGKDRAVPYPLGMEANGEILLKSYCPPYYPTMTAAVHALVDFKFGPRGVFRGGVMTSSWQDPAGAAARIPAPSEQAVAATAAYCEYIYKRYGRFPAYSPPFRTVMGYQAVHVDVEFYERFYKPDALSHTQRDHFTTWHAGEAHPSPLQVTENS